MAEGGLQDEFNEVSDDRNGLKTLREICFEAVVRLNPKCWEPLPKTFIIKLMSKLTLFQRNRLAKVSKLMDDCVNKSISNIEAFDINTIGKECRHYYSVDILLRIVPELSQLSYIEILALGFPKIPEIVNKCSDNESKQFINRSFAEFRLELDESILHKLSNQDSIDITVKEWKKHYFEGMTLYIEGKDIYKYDLFPFLQITTLKELSILIDKRSGVMTSTLIDLFNCIKNSPIEMLELWTFGKSDVINDELLRSISTSLTHLSELVIYNQCNRKELIKPWSYFRNLTGMFLTDCRLNHSILCEHIDPVPHLELNDCLNITSEFLTHYMRKVSVNSDKVYELEIDPINPDLLSQIELPNNLDLYLNKISIDINEHNRRRLEYIASEAVETK